MPASNQADVRCLSQQTGPVLREGTRRRGFMTRRNAKAGGAAKGSGACWIPVGF